MISTSNLKPLDFQARLFKVRGQVHGLSQEHVKSLKIRVLSTSDDEDLGDRRK